MEGAVRADGEGIHKARWVDVPTLNSTKDRISLMAVERENRVEDVLAGEGGVGVIRQMVEQQRDEADVLFGRVPATRVPLEAVSDAKGPFLEMARAFEGMRLGSGEGGGATAGRAVGCSGRRLRSRVVVRGAERVGGVGATVRVHATAATG